MLLAVLMGAGLRAHAAVAPARAVIGIVPAEAEGRLTVQEVAADTPAAEAGICPGDVLLSLGGHPLTTRAEMRDALQAVRAGEMLEIRLLRGARELSFTLVPALRATALPQTAADTGELLKRLRPLKSEIRAALAALPEQAGSTTLRQALQKMQQIAEADSAVAGAGVLRLRDARGYLELREQAGSVVLEAYNEAGERLSCDTLDTAEQCRSLSPELLARCHSLVSVEHYSRAERSGIRPADTVLSINGTEVPDEATLKHLLDTAPDGALIEVYRIDHTEVLALAKKNYKAPRRELKADWDAIEAREEKEENARRSLLWAWAQEHPDKDAVLQAWKARGSDGILTLMDAEGALYFYRAGDIVILKVSVGEDCFETYRSDLPLPKALRRRLLNF